MKTITINTNNLGKKELSLTTGKKAQRYIDAFNESRAYTLDDVYKSYSYNKECAYNYNVEKARLISNKVITKILGHNASTFTMGSLIITSDLDMILRVDTAQNTYHILYNSKRFKA